MRFLGGEEGGVAGFEVDDGVLELFDCGEWIPGEHGEDFALLVCGQGQPLFWYCSWSLRHQSLKFDSVRSRSLRPFGLRL